MISGIDSSRLNELRYGKADPLPESIPIRAGPLTMFYEGGDLRSICTDGYELIRRIYIAVRDKNWGTVPIIITYQQVEISQDHFKISYDAISQQDEIDFRWHALFHGDLNGNLLLRMDGRAITSFMKNRIGFCVLHPAAVSGRKCKITHVDGSQDNAFFPHYISPDQPPHPFTDIKSLDYQVGPVAVNIFFEGDAFEMEDQRNWTDASFKTFSTPLRYAYPVEIHAGTEICQKITLKSDLRAERKRNKQSNKEGLTLDLHSDLVGKLPAIGTGLASHDGSLSLQEIKRLKALKLDHLRVDVWPENLHNPQYILNAMRQSDVLGVPLCLAIHLSNNGEAEIRILTQLLSTQKPRVKLWLVYPEKENYLGGSPVTQVVDWVLNSGILALSKGTAWLVGGSDADFIFLQRNLPPIDRLDAVCFSINPQVHACDNKSVMETLEAQKMVVLSAMKIFGELPVLVSPVTLKPRHNPYATGPILPTPPGDLPAEVDYRQPTLFAAAWLVGSLSSLTVGGCKVITYFETTGWRGLMETTLGSDLPNKFRSYRGGVFPLYHVLADIADFAKDKSHSDADMLRIDSSHCNMIKGLGLSLDNQHRLLVANLTSERQVVTVRGLTSPIQIRFMDETNVVEAITDPDIYRARVSSRSIVRSLKLDLLPYAVATVDW